MTIKKLQWLVLILTAVLLFQVSAFMDAPMRKLFLEAELVVFLLLVKQLLFGSNVRSMSNDYPTNN